MNGALLASPQEPGLLRLGTSFQSLSDVRLWPILLKNSTLRQNERFDIGGNDAG